ncbi:MazG nucleotide pyrophosphohydrolase domain-containing protein [Saccharopolyspora antimicrobica]|uniref:MazG nucleotide pyrophosphohydrolase domain-containing protein n=1 Tax=Saccharopolyspora antimicrobica TaxID=455193 RepID=A0A1I4TYL0_9PSEU|nr:nucleoside triphosphate pyrophosphohydrolase family protein [Saccharopolyspora antimicrobica]RKT88596.1 MazG-like nucleotide pyrophosphohydrolase family protein [Saccharopolyspora antimicrobica]SFM81834.1 MazG nucleotide pyrophosphohydrolase domain-containing protein [Saccharopolyspora antimicrobica]
MDLLDYQRQCRAFDNHEPGLAPLVLGLVSEAGEIAAELEKAARQDPSRRTEAQLRQRVLEEAGDVLWNLTRVIDTLGSTLPEVAAANIAHLRDRYREAGIPLRPVTG